MANFAVTHFDAHHKCCCICYQKADSTFSKSFDAYKSIGFTKL